MTTPLSVLIPIFCANPHDASLYTIIEYEAEKTIQYKIIQCAGIKECQNRMRVNHILPCRYPTILFIS